MPHDFGAISPITEPRFHQYQLLQTIGKGTFGMVKLARHIITGVEVAIKAIDRQGVYRPEQEVKYMKSLNHPNIIKFYQAIDTKSTIFIVMEHASRGSLAEYLYHIGYMKEDEARRIYRQLISAVHYCHQKGIIHRDLKAENVLLDEGLNAKLTDFGLSSRYVGRKMHSFCGTLPYLAPEVIQRKWYDGHAADVWSLGVLLFKMVTGKLPFIGEDEFELRMRVMKGKFRFPYHVSFLCKNVVNKILKVNPQDRVTLEGLMKDPWVNMGQEKELEPYTEQPSDSINPKVVQEMLKFGFEQKEIEEAVIGDMYNTVLATYRILSHRSPKVKHRIIKVRPWPYAEHSPDSDGPSWTEDDQPSHQKAEEPATPPANLDLRTAPPSPALQQDTVDSSTSVIGSKCRGRAPEGIHGENALPAEQPDGVSPSPSSGCGQRCRRLAKRCWNFILKHVCCKSLTKKHRGNLGKRARVKPM